MPEQINVQGTSKNVRNRGDPQMWQLGFEQIVTTIPRRLIDTCRYVDFTRDEWCLVFYPCLKGESQDPEFQQNI